MRKPEREPDLTIGYYSFYFKEMVQWNSDVNVVYDIRVSEDLVFEFFSARANKWVEYGLRDRDLVNEAYLNWQVENIILEQYD
jgi:hypothetical protein